jgi:hypothetical protein
MGWKIFAVLFTVITILGTVNASGYDRPIDVLDTMMAIPAALGLLLFAFGIEFFARRLWRPFALAYVAYSLFYVAILARGLYTQYAIDGKDLSIVLGSFLFFGALQLAVSRGLWRYAFEQHPAAARSS